MALCTITKNILKSNTCQYTLNTITDLYIADFNEVKSAPAISCESGGTQEVTGITLTSGATGFAHIEPQRNSVSYSDNLVVADDGSKYREHTISFTLPGAYDKSMSCSVDALSLGRFFVIVKNSAGQYLVLGRTAGLEASEQSVAGGSDANGISVTLTANTAEIALPLSDAAVEDLLGAVISN